MHGFIERMAKRGREYVVIDLQLSEEDAVKRLLNRRLCKPCG
jgi:adenylate kinase family enzyme